MKYFIAVGFLLSSIFYLAQEDVKKSLVVVHVEPGSAAKFRQQIVAYHFLNGSFTGREDIITVTVRIEGRDYIRTDLGNNLIYKDRYLITGMGNIIDLQEKKVVFDGKASLIRCDHDSAIFYTNDIFKGKFYSVYNFKTAQYGEVKDLLFRPKPGQDIGFDKTVAPFKLYYYPPGKPKITLTEDAGYGQLRTGDHSPDPPLFWINANEFIYARVNKENTELFVCKFNVNTGEQKLIGNKVMINPEKQPATLTQLENQALLLCFGSKQILIDLKTETVADLEYSQPSHGFVYACKDNASGRKIKLDDKELGTFHFRPATFKTGKNIAGFVKEITVGDENYQQGLVVWNSADSAWTTVDADEVLTLVGWLNH